MLSSVTIAELIDRTVSKLYPSKRVHSKNHWLPVVMPSSYRQGDLRLSVQLRADVGNGSTRNNFRISKPFNRGMFKSRIIKLGMEVRWIRAGNNSSPSFRGFNDLKVSSNKYWSFESLSTIQTTGAGKTGIGMFD